MLLLQLELLLQKDKQDNWFGQGGISLNDEKINDINYALSDNDFKDGYAILKKGKKVFHKLVID